MDVLRRGLDLLTTAAHALPALARGDGDGARVTLAAAARHIVDTPRLHVVTLAGTADEPPGLWVTVQSTGVPVPQGFLLVLGDRGELAVTALPERTQGLDKRRAGKAVSGYALWGLLRGPEGEPHLAVVTHRTRICSAPVVDRSGAIYRVDELDYIAIPRRTSAASGSNNGGEAGMPSRRASADDGGSSGGNRRFSLRRKAEGKDTSGGGGEDDNPGPLMHLEPHTASNKGKGAAAAGGGVGEANEMHHHHSSSSSSLRHCLAMWNRVAASHSFYFASRGYDVSRTLQEQLGRRDAAAGSSAPPPPPSAFRCNAAAAAGLPPALQWVFINGAVYKREVGSTGFSGRSDPGIKAFVIARRACQRVGTRYGVRGADETGAVANHAEIETILTRPGGPSASFVQVRGTVPLFWHQRQEDVSFRNTSTKILIGRAGLGLSSGGGGGGGGEGKSAASSSSVPASPGLLRLVSPRARRRPAHAAPAVPPSPAAGLLDDASAGSSSSGGGSAGATAAPSLQGLASPTSGTPSGGHAFELGALHTPSSSSSFSSLPVVAAAAPTPVSSDAPPPAPTLTPEEEEAAERTALGYDALRTHFSDLQARYGPVFVLSLLRCRPKKAGAQAAVGAAAAGDGGEGGVEAAVSAAAGDASSSTSHHHSTAAASPAPPLLALDTRGEERLNRAYARALRKVCGAVPVRCWHPGDGAAAAVTVAAGRGGNVDEAEADRAEEAAALPSAPPSAPASRAASRAASPAPSPALRGIASGGGASPTHPSGSGIGRADGGEWETLPPELLLPPTPSATQVDEPDEAPLPSAAAAGLTADPSASETTPRSPSLLMPRHDRSSHHRDGDDLEEEEDGGSDGEGSVSTTMSRSTSVTSLDLEALLGPATDDEDGAPVVASLSSRLRDAATTPPPPASSGSLPPRQAMLPRLALAPRSRAGTGGSCGSGANTSAPAAPVPSASPAPLTPGPIALRATRVGTLEDPLSVLAAAAPAPSPAPRQRLPPSSSSRRGGGEEEDDEEDEAEGGEEADPAPVSSRTQQPSSSRAASSSSSSPPSVFYALFDFLAARHALGLVAPSLTAPLAPFLARGGFFLADATDAPLRRQHGVVRVNCLDTIDRTQAAQLMLTKLVLPGMLAALLPDGSSSPPPPRALANVTGVIERLWGLAGDKLGRLYVGSNAHDLDDGTGSVGAVLGNAVKSAQRTRAHIFSDSETQAAWNAFLGREPATIVKARWTGTAASSSSLAPSFTF